MVSGYNRNATIRDSDFSYIGGNAIAAWGYTNETASDPGRPGVAIENHPAAGVDGTDGNHPRYGNFDIILAILTSLWIIPTPCSSAAYPPPRSHHSAHHSHAP